MSLEVKPVARAADIWQTPCTAAIRSAFIPYCIKIGRHISEAEAYRNPIATRMGMDDQRVDDRHIALRHGQLHLK